MNALRGIASREMSYSDKDHLLTAGNATCHYDFDGFLLRKATPAGDTWYDYSARGELLKVDLPDGRTIEYTTDPLPSSARPACLLRHGTPPDGRFLRPMQCPREPYGNSRGSKEKGTNR